ncbi:MAG: hypothetical protein SVR08_04150 [Spirochaetota bacterium]|nr:hypothetical protein [Spirochaetota bacterium]
MFNQLYEIEDSKINKYNKIITEAGFHLFEAEILLDNFIKDVINENIEKSLDLKMEIPNQFNAGFLILTLNRIYRNNENGRIEIQINELDHVIYWDELNITIKNLIANFVQLNLLSDEIFNSFSQH